MDMVRSAFAVLMIRNRALMPEEHTADLIGGRLHIKHHAHALADAGIRLAQLQHDGTGEILVAQIGKLLSSPILIMPRRYSIRLRSESSAAALLKSRGHRYWHTAQSAWHQ